VIRQIIKI
jgi:hypothetical protein